MSNFFSEKVLKEIKKFESETTIKKKFLLENECKELLDYFRNLKNKSITGQDITVDGGELAQYQI